MRAQITTESESDLKQRTYHLVRFDERREYEIALLDADEAGQLRAAGFEADDTSITTSRLAKAAQHLLMTKG